MIVLYYQTKTPISFWCRQELKSRSFIQPSEALPVELTRTHIYNINLIRRNWRFKKKKLNNLWIFFLKFPSSLFSQIGVICLNKMEVWCLDYLSQKGLNNICYGLEEMNFSRKSTVEFPALHASPLFQTWYLSDHNFKSSKAWILWKLNIQRFSRKSIPFSKWIPF